MLRKCLLAVLIVLLTVTPTLAGVTVSGLTEQTVPAASDLVMIIDVSDTSMALTGTNMKTQVQYIPKAFPAGSISGATLNPSILGVGSVAGVSLAPDVLDVGAIAGVSLSSSILSVGAIAGVSLSSSILASEAVAGTSITSDARTRSIPFNFGAPQGSIAFSTGNSIFCIVQNRVLLKGADLLAYPTQPSGTGVTIQIYRGVSGVPAISSSYSILMSPGLNTLTNGATSFNTWSGGTYFNAGDVLVAYIADVTSGNTLEHGMVYLKVVNQ